MRKFSDLFEAPQTIVFAFGRFNPPTTGHEKLINKVASIAGSSPYRIYPSFTTNPKKDPLPHSLKVAYMRKMFPKHRKNIIADNKMKTAIFVAEALYKEGFKNLIMVAGSDRVKEFSELLTRYNDAPDKQGKQLFKFDSVKVVSAGERDPDSEGVSGMSASKMRAAATDGDKDAFLSGVPSNFKDGEKLYRDVRKYMGIREERDMGDMSDFETVRDMYLTGKIWNAGDIVEAKGVTGEVVRKGTNYLSFVDEDGKVHKAWLHEIELDEKYDSDKFFGGKGTPEQRLQLLKLQNKALRALGGSPKQKAIKKEIDALRKKMGMKVKEEVELDERNYKKEYANYQGKPEQIERRSSRNKARRVMGDKTKIGMDVGHKDNDPMNNDPENLRNEDPSINRREPRLREVEETLEDMIPWLKKLKNKIFDKTHDKNLNKLSYQYAKQVAKLTKEKKPIKHMTIVHDIAKPYFDVSDRILRDHINALVKKGLIPQELKAEYEPTHETMSFKDFVGQIQINEVKQDKDIKDKKGTQPAKYYAGDMAKSTKDKRDAHFRKKKSGPAPGDADAKTKPSVHTKKFKQMFGEVLPNSASQKDYIDDFEKSDAPQFQGKSKEKRREMAIAAYLSKNESLLDKTMETLNEDGHTDVASMKNKVKVAMSALQKMQGELSKLGDEESLPTWWTNKVATAVSRLDDMSDYLDTQVEEFQLDEKITGLVNKAKKSGMPYGILKKVYDRGLAAYKTGHRPGATAQQWAFARVNSFTTKSAGTWGKADADLAKQVRGEGLEEDPCWDTHKQVGMKKKSGRMVPNCVPKNEEPRIPRKKGQPAGSDKHSDLYTDENPVGTIQGLGFKDVDTAKASVKKIIGSGKTHAHKIQAAIAMEQRAKEMGKTAEASIYRTYIDKMKKKTKEMQEEIKLNEWGEITEKDDKSGKELNNPTKGDVKKYKVYVRNDKGNVVKVEFGDPNMQIKRDDPARRKAFRARHNCDQKKDKTTAGYWSCKFWSTKSVTDLMKG